MNKRTEEIGTLSDLEIEFRLLGSNSYGESGLILINDTTKKVCLFSFLIDSFTGVHNYLKLLKKEKGDGFGYISCICWTHPHEDHTNDLLEILRDKTIISINRKHPNQYDDTTRFIIPSHIKPSRGKFEYNIPNPIDDFYPIINMGGSIGIKVDEYKNKARHKWFVKVTDINRKIPIELIFITPKSKINNTYKGQIYADEFNIISLSFILRVGEHFSIFWGGDCDSDSIFAALEVPEKGRECSELLRTCNIVKIPHHGSNKAKKLPKLFEQLDFAMVTSDTRSNLPREKVLKKFEKILSQKENLLQTKLHINNGDQMGEVKLSISFDNDMNPSYSLANK
ncbi:hypothetical protein [Paraprevotella xylaniphila]|uniref:hypothetical protein n=1 Tax=Paraprevotella xylaniphila TaxID=454155 RepID=UPI0023EF6579|nr:hypothetical protein [Paraprevotella xylaniphila]